MKTENTVFAVVDAKFKGIKSKWFVMENGKLKNVTPQVFEAVQSYNETATTKIPYTLKNNHINYAFGCGLTHYLQNDNVNEALKGLNVDSIAIYTTDDLKNLDSEIVKELKKVSMSLL